MAIGQINIFDDVMKENETFVIVVQGVYNKKGQLIKKILREYPSLDHTAMKRLFEHLKDQYLNEPFDTDQAFFDITVYTNEDYAADHIYAHTKRHRHPGDEWTHTSK
ncbi:hypothetical protein [Macrococcus bovicus]|uniref:Uncharacterized protein n=1 Tax=Macrococcus bovicus TaxID=69968 RepID=A0A4R6C232_9STAP|nr:hypothetical protein [Macrococcus bovicus]TDM15347.1 hypothetical protein ERX55_00105 [Macrococcus bovicus]WJP98758.1 hypothetical protein QSV55_05465 [Macrococcus bovicus]